jgi:glycosyltransferase involved in cell wall biosynthesis
VIPARRTVDRPPRVVYWNNIPAPYMVERFNSLHDRGNVDLEVWFSERTVADRSWRIDEAEWRFRHRYLPRLRLGNQGVAMASPLLAARGPDVLIMQYGAPEYVLAWAAAVLRRWRTAFWVEVTFDTWIRRRAYAEWLKHRMFRRLDGVLTAGEDGAAFARRYGTPNDRIHFVRHVVHSRFYAAGASDAHANRDATRRRLGMAEMVFAYVGRIWEPKGIFDLVDAYQQVRRDGVAASLVVIGDGLDEDRLRSLLAERNLDGVSLVGFVQREELPAWYAIADVLVFPTRGDPYGMVVDEAMAAGLPVISTTNAGEIRPRVIPGETGWLVPAQDRDALARAMAAAAADPARTRAMGRLAAERLTGVEPERWAIECENAISRILAMPRATAAAHRDGRRQ